MSRTAGFLAVLCAAVLAATPSQAQQTSAATQAVVPHFVRYTGTLSSIPADATTAELTFSLYSNPAGGEPLWQEKQQVAFSSTGGYQVLLGSAVALPDSLFQAGDARWVGVAVNGGQEATRTRLTATAYSLKASDAETLGGHPASDFALATPNAVAITQINAGTGLTGGGTGPTVSLGLSTTYLQQLGNSAYAQLNAANTLKGNQTINGNLTVNGEIGGTALNNLLSAGDTVYAQLGTANAFHGTQTLAAAGTATSSTAYASNALDFVASAYNSSGKAAQNATFQWKNEATGNNTATPGGALHLLYGAGTAAPAETGLTIANNGRMTFASGQTFPGVLTGITAGNGITATDTNGVVTLSVNPSSLTSTFAELGVANTFTAQQTVSGANSSSMLDVINSNSGSGIAVLAGSPYIGMEAYTTGSSASAVGLYAESNSGIGLIAYGNSLGMRSFIGVPSVTYSHISNLVGGAAIDGGQYGQVGLFATADNNSAIAAGSNSSNSTISASNAGSGPTGYFVGNAGGQYTVIAQNNAAGPAGYFTGASTTTPTLSVINRVTSNPQNTTVAQFLGDNAGNVGCTVFGDGRFSCSKSVIGYSPDISDPGTFGVASGSTGVGAFGVGYGGVSNTNAGFGGGNIGVVGDGGAQGGTGVIAFADNGIAGEFLNSSPTRATVYASNSGNGPGSLTIAYHDYPAILGTGMGTTEDAYFGSFNTQSSDGCVFHQGTLDCGHDINSGQTVGTGYWDPSRPQPVGLFEGKEVVTTTAVMASSAWIEDAGSAQLVDGHAVVTLAPELQQIGDTTVAYQVFLTPGAECEGLYVTEKKTGSFEVHELRHGTSSLSFDYRVLVRKAGHDATKFKPVAAEELARRDFSKIELPKSKKVTEADTNK